MKRELTDQEKAADKCTSEVLDAFHCKMRSLSLLATSQLTHAKENQEKAVAALAIELKQATERFQVNSENVRERAQAVTTLVDATNKISHLSFSHEQMLAQIIFISIFSAFDAYLNHLLLDLYSRTPALLNRLQHRNITFADILKHPKEEIVNSVIGADLNSLLRESYSDIFKKLAKRFGVTTLTQFQNWRLFVECSQRRNLLTHCDGVVNSDYLKNCREADVKIPSDVNLGTQLTVSMEYLQEAIDVVTEVGIKLGQVLWRASCEASITSADSHLANMIFEFLKLEKWTLSLRMGEFGNELAKRGNQNLREDRVLRIIILNHAQAAKWSGDERSARKLLDAVDWSGSINEFQLAVAVLKEEYDNAATLMRRVGTNSELCPVHGYVGWPIFREFRSTPQFSTAFRTIYGVPFEDEVKKATEETISAESVDKPQSGDVIMPADPTRK